MEIKVSPDVTKIFTKSGNSLILCSPIDKNIDSFINQLQPMFIFGNLSQEQIDISDLPLFTIKFEDQNDFNERLQIFKEEAEKRYHNKIDQNYTHLVVLYLNAELIEKNDFLKKFIFEAKHFDIHLIVILPVPFIHPELFTMKQGNQYQIYKKFIYNISPRMDHILLFPKIDFKWIDRTVYILKQQDMKKIIDEFNSNSYIFHYNNDNMEIKGISSNPIINHSKDYLKAYSQMRAFQQNAMISNEKMNKDDEKIQILQDMTDIFTKKGTSLILCPKESSLKPFIETLSTLYIFNEKDSLLCLKNESPFLNILKHLQKIDASLIQIFVIYVSVELLNDHLFSFIEDIKEYNIHLVLILKLPFIEDKKLISQNRIYIKFIKKAETYVDHLINFPQTYREHDGYRLINWIWSTKLCSCNGHRGQVLQEVIQTCNKENYLFYYNYNTGQNILFKSDSTINHSRDYLKRYKAFSMYVDDLRKYIMIQ